MYSNIIWGYWGENILGELAKEENFKSVNSWEAETSGFLMKTYVGDMGLRNV